MGILGGLASQAIPQLLTFATKKLLSTPIGQQVARTYRSPMVQQMKADFIQQMKEKPEESEEEYFEEEVAPQPVTKKKAIKKGKRYKWS